MSKHLFTEEEVYQLSQNPNVESVTSRTVRFNKNFRKALRQACKNGTKVQDFLKANGIDPEILGETRIRGLLYKSDSTEEFEHQAPFNNRDSLQIIVPDKSDKSVQERLRALEVKSAYQDQEIEFLKKLLEADLEARKNQVFEPDPV